MISELKYESVEELWKDEIPDMYAHLVILIIVQKMENLAHFLCIAVVECFTYFKGLIAWVHKQLGGPMGISAPSLHSLIRTLLIPVIFYVVIRTLSRP